MACVSCENSSVFLILLIRADEKLPFFLFVCAFFLREIEIFHFH